MNRRQFLHATTAAAVMGLVGRSDAAEQGPPNVVVILADDLGYGDLSCYGGQDIRTPNIGGLAREGMRFTSFYANSPVCSPTRASLLTGRYPPLVGVPGVIRTHANNSWGHLVPDAVLMPQLLKKAGYDTAIVGKWHLGLESPNTPNERGFDEFHGFLGDMMDDYNNHRRHGINYMRHNGKEIGPPGHATDLFTQWACEYIKGRSGNPKPFFLYLPYNAPHGPIQPPAQWVEKVMARQPGITKKRAALVALIEHLDDGIGKVLAALDATGTAKNTLVVFLSDNGGDLAAGATSGANRNGKGTVYEGGIKVPAIFRWPGKIAAGSVSSRVAMTMDILPTVLGLAGAPAAQGIDGATFLGTLRGEVDPNPQRDLFFSRMEGFREKPGGTIEAIRRGAWKLLRPAPGKKLELYDLQSDPMEKADLYETVPAVAVVLRKALEAQVRRYEQVPWKKQG